jgi:hypothetical protein
VSQVKKKFENHWAERINFCFVYFLSTPEKPNKFMQAHEATVKNVLTQMISLFALAHAFNGWNVIGIFYVLLIFMVVFHL